MAEDKEHKDIKLVKSVDEPHSSKGKKVADPVKSSIDLATQEMIARAQELGIDTVFDRTENMKPCSIGVQGTCCKNCSMGPCRLPLPKSGIEGNDERKGLCGATANTIASRNFIRMIAHIDQKRLDLGIDRARERIMVDMADRRDLASV